LNDNFVLSYFTLGAFHNSEFFHLFLVHGTFFTEFWINHKAG
jgi:hypothetical protein